MLQIGDLETMARERLNAVLIVFNNFRLGSQRKRVEAYGPVIGVDRQSRFCKTRRTLRLSRLSRRYAGAICRCAERCIGVGEPCVIDVIVDPEARPPRIALSREAR